MVGTLFYANQYTSTHEASNNTFQKGNATMHQGELLKRPENGSKGGPTNATNKKPEN